MSADLWTQSDTSTWVYAARFVTTTPCLTKRTQVVLHRAADDDAWTLSERLIPDAPAPAHLGALVVRLAELASDRPLDKVFAWALEELRYTAYDRAAHALETTKHLSRHIEECKAGAAGQSS